LRFTMLGCKCSPSPFPLPLASFFALSPFFVRPKLVRSPISIDFWVFLSLKVHRNACYASYHSSYYWFGYLNFVTFVCIFVNKIDHQLKILWLSTFIDKFTCRLSTNDLSTKFSMIDSDQHVTTC